MGDGLYSKIGNRFTLMNLGNTVQIDLTNNTIEEMPRFKYFIDKMDTF
jgi:hypothetical protein